HHIERLATNMKRRMRAPDDRDRRSPLSAFECDLLAHMLLGRTDAETAKILGFSPAHVSKYALIAVRKLGARNRVHAVARIFAAVLRPGEDREPPPAAEPDPPVNEDVRALMRDLFDAAGGIE